MKKHMLSCSIVVEKFEFVLLNSDSLELKRQRTVWGLADYAFDRGAMSVTHSYDLLKVSPDGTFRE